ncbi:MAG: hypothetical protein VW995_12500 [Deltaproteobacteria bacterium]
MEAELQALVEQAEAGKDAIDNRPQLADFKAGFVGPNGSLTAASKSIGKLPKEEKPAFGKKINQTKQALEAIFRAIEERLEVAELAAKLGPPIDPTLPHPDALPGTEHPLTQTRDRIIQIFRKIGVNEVTTLGEHQLPEHQLLTQPIFLPRLQSVWPLK